MSILADAESRVAKPNQFLVDRHLADMNDTDRGEALEILRNADRFGPTTVARVLTAHGFPCSDKAVRSWRQKEARGDR